MDDIKLYGKTTKDVTALVCGVGDDIGMNLNPAKCAVLHVRRGKPDEGCSIQVGDETIAESLLLNETYKLLSICIRHLFIGQICPFGLRIKINTTTTTTTTTREGKVIDP